MGCSFFCGSTCGAYNVGLAPSMASHLRCSVASGFQPSMGFIWLWRAIKQSARLRSYQLLSPLSTLDSRLSTLNSQLSTLNRKVFRFQFFLLSLRLEYSGQGGIPYRR